MKSKIFSVTRYFLLATLIGLSIGLVANAQEVTGTIVGTVRDANGGAVPGATVTIADAAKGNLVVRTVTTNDDGEFNAPLLQSSVYQITVEAKNFKKVVKSGVKLDVGQRRSVDVSLEAGRIEEVVNIEADPVAVDTTSAASGTLINGDQVKEIPVNNRNWVQLTTLAPGTTNDLNDSVSVGTTAPETGAVNLISVSVNGARSSQNTFTVDGADITDRGSNLTIQAYPSVDSIGEFRVLRSLYPAESGRSGGGQVNVITRSGGKKYRGSVFEYLRNDKLNANDFISNQTPSLARTLGREGAADCAFTDTACLNALQADSSKKLKRRPFRYNNYGWTFSGPVIFPNFGDHPSDAPMFKKASKTFFFFSQEFRKDRRYPLLTSTVPTAGLRQGVFTVPICLQAIGTTCTTTLAAGTPISNLRTISPIAQKYLQYVYSNVPLPNSSVAFQLNYPTKNVADFRQEVIKIDHSFNDKASMYYRYQQDKIPTIDANALFSSGSGIPDVSTTSTNSPGKTHTAQFVYAFSSSLILETRYAFGYGAILSENIGLLSFTRSPIAPPSAYPVTRDRVPTITGHGFSALQGYGPYDNFSWKQNFNGTLTWIKGNHSMKFGAVYSLYRKNENNLSGSNEGTFSAFNTPGATQNVTASGGNATQQLWANFLMGTNVTYTQASFDYEADLRQKTFEGFAQDEWKARSNITLYVGIRYSFFGSPWDKNGRLSNFVPELWKASQAPSVTGVVGATPSNPAFAANTSNRVPGSGNYCNGLIVNAQNTVAFPNCTPTLSPWGKFVVDVSKKDFAPRIGVAWDIFGKGKSVIRTGYGIYHEQTLNATYLNNIIQNPPFQQTCSVTGTSLDNPVPAGGCSVIASNAVASIRANQPNWDTPYMQHWSFDYQHQIDKKTMVTVGYYGSKGTHLIGQFEKNLLAPGEAIARGVLGCAIGESYFGQVGATLGSCQTTGTPFYSSTAEAILDQIRPYRGYRSISMVETRYNSNYHSMQVSATRRFTGASQVNLAYTWARNMTDNQNDRSAAPQNSYDISKDYARAALDRRHVLSINYVYELPFFRDQKGFVGKTLGGWQASGIITYNTGLPFTATTSGYDPAGLGILPPPFTVGRPNVTCDPNQGGAGTFESFFNTSCFQITPNSGTTGLPNTVGNAGRGVINGPSTTRVDFTMSKNFKLSERFKLQLRAEAFNIFNKTNFRGLTTGVWAVSTAPVANGGTCTSGCSTFGRVTSVRDPRQIQLGVRFSF